MHLIKTSYINWQIRAKRLRTAVCVSLWWKDFKMDTAVKKTRWVRAERIFTRCLWRFLRAFFFPATSRGKDFYHGWHPDRSCTRITCCRRCPIEDSLLKNKSQKIKFSGYTRHNLPPPQVWSAFRFSALPLIWRRGEKHRIARYAFCLALESDLIILRTWRGHWNIIRSNWCFHFFCAHTRCRFDDNARRWGKCRILRRWSAKYMEYGDSNIQFYLVFVLEMSDKWFTRK